MLCTRLCTYYDMRRQTNELLPFSLHKMYWTKLLLADKEKYALFTSYCQNGNIEQVENMLKSGEIDLNYSLLHSNFDPLNAAIESGIADMVESILKYGAHGKALHINSDFTNDYYVHCEDTQLLSPLRDAVASKNVRDVKLLVENGADFGIYAHVDARILSSCFRDDFDETAWDIIQLLIKHNIYKSLQFLFSSALWWHLVNFVKCLIDKGTDVNSRLQLDNCRFDGLLPLCVACNGSFYSKESHDLVEILLKSGSNPNMKSIDGKCPLLRSSDEFTKQKLLDFGADINATDEYGNTALHLCSGKNVPNLLISRGINTDIRNQEGKTAREFLQTNYNGFFLNAYDRSMKEIAKIKSIILNSYGLTLYDILLINRHDLIRYINNVNLKTILEDKLFLQKFPEFGERLKEKLDQAKKRVELIKQASLFLQKMTGYKIPELLCFMLYKYFTDHEMASAFLSNKTTKE